MLSHVREYGHADPNSLPLRRSRTLASAQIDRGGLGDGRRSGRRQLLRPGTRQTSRSGAAMSGDERVRCVADSSVKRSGSHSRYVLTG